METSAILLGGLGLFFIGVRAIGHHLQAMAGPRTRRAAARLTGGPLAGGAVGLALGLLTQSSNAVTFIAASMQAAGLVTVRRALPVLAWANPGTAALVLLASIDLRLAALLLLGLAGCMTYFSVDGGGRWRAAWQALIGLGLLFLGLSLLKTGGAALRDAPMVAEILSFAAEAELVGFVIGLAMTLLAQSSSTVSILAITMHDAGLLSHGQAAMLILGASAGSGLATYTIAAGLRGSQRRMVLYQLWFKLLGATLFLALELLGWVDPLLAALAQDPGIQLALLFAAIQLVSALLAMPLNGLALRLLEWRVPESAAESLARPQYLYDRALDDPASALGLALLEQQRLTTRLPLLLDGVRKEAPAPHLPAVELGAASAQVEAAIEDFLLRLLAAGPGTELLAEAVRLEARLRMLRDLRLAVLELVAAAPALDTLVEPLHMLLEQAADADAHATLLMLTEDRGALMRRLRAARADAMAPDMLHRATAAFERAVWLLRSLLMLDAEAREA